MNNKYKILPFLLFSFFIFLPISHASGASFFISPETRSYDLSSTFSVSAHVKTDQAINAANGIIFFPTDKLQVVSISKNGSIFSLWAQEPSFSNTLGTITFEGVILNPGFIGSNGKILNITFKTKAAGNALLRFSSGSILANDGEGTNILSSMGSAQFVIGDIGPVAPEGSTISEVVSTPSPILINSQTHPDPEKWYQSKNASFFWNLPSGTTGVRTLVNKSPNALPTLLSTSSISSREVKDLSDGIWYFHLQLRNESGWGSVSHFRFQIDSEKPDRLNFVRTTSESASPAQAAFLVDAIDRLSGIEHYEIQIDNATTSFWKDDGSGIYITPSLQSGNHIITIKAIDKAGNFLSAFSNFEIDEVSKPTIIYYSKEMYPDGILAVRGTSTPNGFVQVNIRYDNRDEKTQKISVDENGFFTFILDEKLLSGTYSFIFKTITIDGRESDFTEPIITAVYKPWSSKINEWIIKNIITIIIIFVFLLLFFVLFKYFLHNVKTIRRHIHGSTIDVQEDIHEIFKNLQNDIKNVLSFLDHIKTKRDLTKEEEKIRIHIEKSLSNAEREIKRKIKNIEKK